MTRPKSQYPTESPPRKIPSNPATSLDLPLWSPVAAAVAGLASSRGRGWFGAAVWLAAAVGLIHLGGLSWLAILGGESLATSTGVRPFILGDILKVLLVLAVGRWVRARRNT